MAKRGPQSKLDDRNWDDEEEPEEAGIFKQASKDTLQSRVIKKAKRRGGPEEGGAKPSGAFGGFGGLVSKQTPAAAPLSSFSFGAKTAEVKATGSGMKTSSTSSEFITGGATSSMDNNLDSATNKNETSSSKDNSAYLHALKSLNDSVLSWIKQHVEKNPYIILTPIFKDYEKYHASLESKKATASNGSSSTSTSAFSSSGFNKNNGSDMKASTTAATFSAFAPKNVSDEVDSKKDGKEENKEKDSPTKSTGFTFGSVSSANGDGIKFSTATAATTTSGFSFGKTSTSISSGFSFGQSSSTSSATTATTASSGFSFGNSATSSTAAAPFGASGFSFGNLAAAKAATDKAQSENSQTQGDDDDYVPPKPEVKEIKEEGSLYSKRCKLFYQKEGQWVERGVGNVHVKPLDDPKTQLLVRADTNLGNILLNINLTSGLPVSRQGKNNVLLVCVPNPPLKDGDTDQTPIPMLIRVKTAEEADELLAKLKERKALL